MKKLTQIALPSFHLEKGYYDKLTIILFSPKHRLIQQSPVTSENFHCNLTSKVKLQRLFQILFKGYMKNPAAEAGTSDTVILKQTK